MYTYTDTHQKRVFAKVGTKISSIIIFLLLCTYTDYIIRGWQGQRHGRQRRRRRLTVTTAFGYEIAFAFPMRILVRLLVTHEIFVVCACVCV